MGKRKLDEKQFHDILRRNSLGQRWSPKLEKLINTDPLWANMKYYSVERKSRDLVLKWFANNCKGKKVLDYCCGNGDDSFIISDFNAKETIGVDISETSINNCNKRAYGKEPGKSASFYVMDAEALQFEDNYFDIVTEYGALHHLNIDRAYSELARVLEPSGKCICTEALGHNPLIHYYRKKTPHLRTNWEIQNIMRRKDIKLAKEYFRKVEILGFFHLATLAAVPFRNLSGFEFLLTTLEAIDNILLKLPILKWQSWQVVFVLSHPKKERCQF